MFYGHIAFVEGGVSSNDLMFFVAIPFLSLTFMIAAVVVAWRATRRIGPLRISWFGEKRLSDILAAVALSVIVVTVDAILRYLLKRVHIPTKDFFLVSTTTPGIALLAVQSLRIVLVTPIVEEVFWRGYTQGVLQRTFNRPLALFAQAALFALVHMRGLAGRLPIFFLGLTLGIWRDRKASLVPLIAAHMILNSMWCARFWHYQMELRMVRTTHDYRAQLEELCRPTDCTSEENALPHYKQAFELLLERPKELDGRDIEAWPADLSPDSMNLLRNWISSNQYAIAEFELGTRKPYYCPEYSNESFDDVTFPVFSEAANMVFVVSSRAQIHAIEGDLREAVSDVLTCYRFGQHLAAPKPLAAHVMGLAVKDQATRVAFRILDRTWPADPSLRKLQFGLEGLTDRGIAPIDFAGERLICHGQMQEIFTDDGKGGGHIPRLILEYMRNPPPHLRSIGLPVLTEEQALAWEKLERRQTTRVTDQVFARLDSIKSRSPAELRWAGQEAEDILLESAEHNAFLLALIPAYAKLYHTSYRLKACQDGLIVTLAIMRYRLEHSDLPDELGHLVGAGYLDSLPPDPYSDEPFVYRKVGLDFVLYSLGPDFDDDRGTKGDDVFWPLANNQK